MYRLYLKVQEIIQVKNHISVHKILANADQYLALHEIRYYISYLEFLMRHYSFYHAKHIIKGKDLLLLSDYMAIVRNAYNCLRRCLLTLENKKNAQIKSLADAGIG